MMMPDRNYEIDILLIYTAYSIQPGFVEKGFRKT
jgi:hypothetical protein